MASSAQPSNALVVPRVDDELLELLRSEMTTDEQQLFMMSFALYLKHGMDDFVVDFDDVWGWAGFTSKGHAKRLLIKLMVQGKHYILLARSGKQDDQDDAKHGGHNKETIMMTTNAFKRLCLAARTAKGERVQEYFLTMERVLLEHMQTKLAQQADAHSRELDTQQQAHEIAAKKTRHDALMAAHEGTPVVYLAELAEFGELPDGRFLVKYGESDNIVSRFHPLHRDYGDIYFVESYVCTQPHKFEQWLKQQEMFVRLKYNGTIKGRQHKELLAVTPDEYKKLTFFIKKHLHKFQGWTAEQTLEKMRLQMEMEKQRSQVEMSRFQAFQAFPEIFKSMSSVINPALRTDAEQAMVDAMRSLSHMTPVQSQQICATSEQSEDVEMVYDDDDDIVPITRISSSGGSSGTSSPTEVVTEGLPISVIAVATTQPTTEPASDASDGVHLFPPQPKKKLGRPAKVKVPPLTDANTPLQRFIDECFDTSNPDAKTHMALVRARHRIWRATHVTREDTNNMVNFFKDRFNVVSEWDPAHDMKSSFYVGLSIRPWVPPSAPESTARADIDAFVREACEVHVMGRALTNDLWDAFVAWKKEQESNYTATKAERSKFIAYMNISFVYDTGVPISAKGTGAPGFYGIYIKTATAETRAVGWNRSPNTHFPVLKLDARGNIMEVIDSQDSFARTVAKKSPQHICVEFTRCFNDGMRGLIMADGYEYMRSKDHAAMLIARAARTSA